MDPLFNRLNRLNRFNRRKASALAVATLTAALGLVPVGTAQAAACQWQKTAWELPPTTTVGTVSSSDGGRYAVGVTGTRSPSWPTDITNGRGTLWDNGKVVLRLPAGNPNLSGVNAAGLIVGGDLVNNKLRAVTVSHTGTTTVLPFNPNWNSSSASVVNNAGDIAGMAKVGTNFILVVWPANAPGTYRELPLPASSFLLLNGIDEQGRIVGSTDAFGFVSDINGQWHALAAQGSNAYSDPAAVRDGRIVGGTQNNTSYAEAEWDAQGSLIRTIGAGAISASAIGGNGIVGGTAFVGSIRRPVLWRDGVVADSLPAVSDSFTIRAISTDEKTLIGNENSRPVNYTCS
ncbi:hypothetical protein ACFV84_21065 [Kitasatospora sp. NPDC059811]|uniref:hypothetical protein n=1 Tax=Streptomycetaceae TaxID=2062 RepID=UPI00133179D9|nr:hypothetical protein [Streptomyces sp. MJM8645]